ncbi:MAG: hypothetical protein K9H61_05005 [Bacteroidia bacterium]|nr:hypothetical protein [Bacteroidia bacterium]MCF8446337.1 hypothetical protein [Bacteroidia bacterium]
MRTFNFIVACIFIVFNQASGQTLHCERLYKGIYAVDDFSGEAYLTTLDSNSYVVKTGICYLDSSIGSFEDNAAYDLKLVLKGDTLGFIADGIVYPVFSSYCFRNRLFTYYYKTVHSKAFGELICFEEYEPRTVLTIQGQKVYHYKITYFVTDEIDCYENIRFKLQKLGKLDFDPNYKSSNVYFIPAMGFVFYSDSELKGFKLFEDCERNPFLKFSKGWE